MNKINNTTLLEQLKDADPIEVLDLMEGQIKFLTHNKYSKYDRRVIEKYIHELLHDAKTHPRKNQRPARFTT